VCASYLFVFMSNSLDKTNTVTTQKKEEEKKYSKVNLATCHVHVQRHNKKTGDHLLSLLFSIFNNDNLNKTCRCLGIHIRIPSNHLRFCFINFFVILVVFLFANAKKKTCRQ